MKLRLNASSVRLRCAVSEVAALASAGRVTTRVPFPDGRTLEVVLSSVDAADSGEPRVVFAGDRIEVSLPAAQAAAWTGSAIVGVYGRHGALDILVEKDFRRTSRPSPDDGDRYPNPAAAAAATPGSPPAV
jgi:hypothetical protein